MAGAGVTGATPTGIVTTGALVTGRPGPPRLLRLLAVVAALLLAAALGVRPVSAATPGVVEHPAMVPARAEVNGPVSLDVSVFTPAGDAGTAGSARHPAVILAHGFGGSKADLAGQARTLAGAGYVVLTYTARGFGASGGAIHLDAPAWEVADVSTLVDVLARRPDVELDAPGDPRVGIAGGSYGGGLALLAAAYDHRIDAVLSALAWNDLSTALFPQAATITGEASAFLDEHSTTAAAGDPGPLTPAFTRPLGTTGVFKQRWTALLFQSGGSGGSGGGGQGGGGAATSAVPEPTTKITPDTGNPTGDTSDTSGGLTGAPAVACGRFDPVLCRLYLQTAQTGLGSPQLTGLLLASSPSSVISRIRVPTLLVQGEQDSLFGLDQADANARGIAANGAPVAVQWIAGGHDSVTGADTDLSADGVAWFDRYLRHDRATAATPSGWTFAAPVAGSTAIASAAANSQGGSGGGTAREQALAAQTATQDLHLGSYPGLTTGSATPTRTVHLGGDAQSLLSPAGGVPAAITSLPGTSGLSILDGAGLGSSLGILAGQSATFRSNPVPAAFRITGTSHVRLSVTSSTTDATLFAGLWITAADGTATLPASLVAPLRLTDLSPGVSVEVAVDLPAIVAAVPAGSRLELVVSATDQAYAVPLDTRLYRIGLPSGLATIPVAAGAVLATAPAATVPLPLLIAAIAVLVGAALLALVVRRGRRHPGGGAHPGAELAAVPLVVAGLSKTYGDRRVVTDVSWRADRGQVVGLLGPNGAGKTTTMRMLVGLVRPDAGSVSVLGEAVVPGAAVLARVGAFIEGPGFLPHLTGRENLDAFWSATGRPAADAHLESALEIAGLHAAVDRRVRGYSQGMRQRLGVAQAMLGLPDLLILDEPTNGLDPPQIQRMRTVLRDYAATGRTVVVSSHLISEVEQTCDHVVVMRDGTVVMTGAVEDLVSAGNSVALDVDDVDRAALLVRCLPGVGDVDVVGTGRVVAHLAGASRHEVVATLVRDGIAVSAVSSRASLEDVVLSAIGQAGVQ